MKNICNNKRCKREFEDQITVNGMDMYCLSCLHMENWGIVVGITIGILFSAFTVLVMKGLSLAF